MLDKLDIGNLGKELTDDEIWGIYSPGKWIATHDVNYVCLLAEMRMNADPEKANVYGTMIESVHYGHVSASLNPQGEVCFQYNKPN